MNPLRFQRHRRLKVHYERKKPQPDAPTFIPALARFDGRCGICNAAYELGDRIYWCRKTRTTRTMRVHQSCYLQRTGAFVPSFKASPRESDLKRMREVDNSPH